MDVMATPAEGVIPHKRRITVTPAIELGVLAVALLILFGTYRYISRSGEPGQLLSPAIAASLLLANLLPAVILVILLGRRIAKHRAAKTALAGGGQLHIRLVATFSLIASVPIVLTVITASIMFQSGVQLWDSQRARTAFNSTIDLVKEGQSVVAQRWGDEARAMVTDINTYFPEIPSHSPAFEQLLLRQTYVRNFYHSVVFRIPDGKNVDPLYAYMQPNEQVFAQRVTGVILNKLKQDPRPYVNFNENELWVVAPINRAQNEFLYVATPVNADFLNSQTESARAIVRDYGALQNRARALQVRFNGALYGVALLIVGLAMWIAIIVADRLVRPVDQLVIASRRISEGDFSARVPTPDRADEIGTLGIAFNSMTERLEQQTGALVTANAQLESRRALIEAVMSGVSAGVISIDRARTVRLINESARALLRHGEGNPVGRPLSEVAPELDVLLDGQEAESVVEIGSGVESLTLAVKVTRGEDGQVLTFDDITQQLLDQRRAAWSDVARRIAHEIKNPLTPIQLAAERLQRRYGGKEDGTFAQLTGTIIRQVGDLRRMVDEFSSFARMPKPVFRSESLLDIARQSLFLHEVAHPAVTFRLVHEDEVPPVVCDRRQIGQAFTNIVKNAIEAIEARGEDAKGEVTMTLASPEPNIMTVEVADNGIGLPVARDRLVEPYVTTRARGTGLGLAIVKKIVEEHCGTIAFGDREGGGTLVTMRFDTAALDALDTGAAAPEHGADGDPRFPELVRNRT
jgi:two-component system nitrogen regulation sensor histidine kinase NtrY